MNPNPILETADARNSVDSRISIDTRNSGDVATSDSSCNGWKGPQQLALAYAQPYDLRHSLAAGAR